MNLISGVSKLHFLFGSPNKKFLISLSFSVWHTQNIFYPVIIFQTSCIFKCQPRATFVPYILKVPKRENVTRQDKNDDRILDLTLFFGHPPRMMIGFLTWARGACDWDPPSPPSSPPPPPPHLVLPLLEGAHGIVCVASSIISLHTQDISFS